MTRADRAGLVLDVPTIGISDWPSFRDVFAALGFRDYDGRNRDTFPDILAAPSHC